MIGVTISVDFWLYNAFMQDNVRHLMKLRDSIVFHSESGEYLWKARRNWLIDSRTGFVRFFNFAQLRNQESFSTDTSSEFVVCEESITILGPHHCDFDSFSIHDLSASGGNTSMISRAINIRKGNGMELKM